MTSHRKDQSFLDMTVPKRTSGNFEDFDLDFQGDARRQVVISRISLEYVILPNGAGNYNIVWN